MTSWKWQLMRLKRKLPSKPELVAPKGLYTLKEYMKVDRISHENDRIIKNKAHR